eukprot:jgi/Mesvir1/6532/Mv16794-RA.1
MAPRTYAPADAERAVNACISEVTPILARGQPQECKQALARLTLQIRDVLTAYVLPLVQNGEPQAISLVKNIAIQLTRTPNLFETSGRNLTTVVYHLAEFFIMAILGVGFKGNWSTAWDPSLPSDVLKMHTYYLSRCGTSVFLTVFHVLSDSWGNPALQRILERDPTVVPGKTLLEAPTLAVARCRILLMNQPKEARRLALFYLQGGTTLGDANQAAGEGARRGNAGGGGGGGTGAQGRIRQGRVGEASSDLSALLTEPREVQDLMAEVVASWDDTEEIRCCARISLDYCYHFRGQSGVRPGHTKALQVYVDTLFPPEVTNRLAARSSSLADVTADQAAAATARAHVHAMASIARVPDVAFATHMAVLAQTVFATGGLPVLGLSAQLADIALQVLECDVATVPVSAITSSSTTRGGARSPREGGGRDRTPGGSDRKKDATKEHTLEDSEAATLGAALFPLDTASLAKTLLTMVNASGVTLLASFSPVTPAGDWPSATGWFAAQLSGMGLGPEELAYIHLQEGNYVDALELVNSFVGLGAAQCVPSADGTVESYTLGTQGRLQQMLSAQIASIYPAWVYEASVKTAQAMLLGSFTRAKFPVFLSWVRFMRAAVSNGSQEDLDRLYADVNYLLHPANLAMGEASLSQPEIMELLTACHEVIMTTTRQPGGAAGAGDASRRVAAQFS